MFTKYRLRYVEHLFSQLQRSNVDVDVNVVLLRNVKCQLSHEALKIQKGLSLLMQSR